MAYSTLIMMMMMTNGAHYVYQPASRLTGVYTYVGIVSGKVVPITVAN